MPETGVECPVWELDALHQYLDGELSFARQPDLFAHLSDCCECRRMMESVMHFRRMSRQEYLALPPSADEAFFERLAHQKERGARVDRESDRRPLWDSSRAITLRSALFMAAAVFLIGLLVPMPSRTDYGAPLIQLEVERVKFNPVRFRSQESVIYYWYPGLEVIADRENGGAREDGSVVLESFE